MLVCLAIAAVENVCTAQSVEVFVNGAPITLETSPMVVDDQLYLPLRQLFNLLGAHVTWIPGSQSIAAYRGDMIIGLRLGSMTAEVNGLQVTSPAAPQLISGAVFVPLRSIASLLGAQVEYSSQTVNIAIPPVDLSRQAPKEYSQLIDRYTRDGYRGCYVWAKCFDGPNNRLTSLTGLPIAHLERMQIVEISRVEAREDQPWVDPLKERMVTLQNSKGQTGTITIRDYNWYQGYDYDTELEYYFYLDNPFMHYHWPESTWNLIRANLIQIGMTPDMVRMSWGDPKRVNRTIYTFGVHEQWVYGSRNYVYFEDGKVTTIQN